MYSYNAVNNVYTLLKDIETSDFTVIKGYPFVKLPNPLTKSVVAVLPGKTEVSAAAIGEAEQSGKIGVDVFVYTPQSLGSGELTGLCEAALIAMLELAPSSIAVSSIYTKDYLGCLGITCTVTFDGVITQEENDG